MNEAIGKTMDEIKAIYGEPDSKALLPMLDQNTGDGNDFTTYVIFYYSNIEIYINVNKIAFYATDIDILNAERGEISRLLRNEDIDRLNSNLNGTRKNKIAIIFPFIFSKDTEIWQCYIEISTISNYKLEIYFDADNKVSKIVKKPWNED